ncbi:MAG: tellurite resistance protein [Halobacteriovoraceae bacterium]|nr:tellurite resistance protein [Halobacteriovoraceae bacterium]|tara:strand:- start:2648 stop:2920 length:273 start_codon:yes stop_codon:yes gene_type:complete
MKKIPLTARAYKKTNIFNEKTVPKALLEEHSTKANVWGKIVVLEGRLIYSIPSKNEELELTASNVGIVEPEVKHLVKPVGKVKFYVEFYK